MTVNGATQSPVNLLNLLPVLPLDGGRAMAALSPWVWIAGYAALVALIFVFPNPILLLVLIFDRMIPPGRDPPFLADSRLRPILSKAGQAGLKSLPPEAADFIDRLKRARQ